MKQFNYLISAIIFAVTLTSCQAKEPMETSNEAPKEPTEKVVKTEAEWKKTYCKKLLMFKGRLESLHLGPLRIPHEHHLQRVSRQ